MSKKKIKSVCVEHHIRVICEGSCDTEDWSNDAENSALITGYKLHFTIYSHYLH